MCVTLKKREAARVCVCDLVYRTLACSWSPAQSLEGVGSCVSIAGYLSSHPNRTT